MVKKFFEINIFLLLFISSILNIFAFESKLEVDKNTNNINDNIKLNIEISSEKGGNFEIGEIKGIKNFEILGESKNQSSYSQTIVKNGKTEQKNTIVLNKTFILKAKEKGEFELGPVILRSGEEQVKTNSVKIKVEGTNIGINNISTKNQQNPSTQTKEDNENEDKQNQKLKHIVDEDEYLGNNYNLYLLLFVLFSSAIGFYIILKNKPEILEKKEKSDIQQDIILPKKKEIIYPEIGNLDFIDKITSIFKEKISDKYNIKNIENLTFEEILGITGKIDNIEKIISEINKIKYSNIEYDKNKILKLIENF